MIDDDEAMRRAVKAYYDGAGFESLEKATGKPIKYTKKFFDDQEAHIRKGLVSKDELESKEVKK